MPDFNDLPRHARVRFAHAWIEVVARTHDFDVLHLKGPALAEGLGRMSRNSSDTDVLVRPRHLERCLETLRAGGWRQVTEFDSSAFEHAANFHHPDWGMLDLHRHWPGFSVDPERAFDILWRDRSSLPIADRACTVPSHAAQLLILTLHSARGMGGAEATADLESGWHSVSSADQAAARALANELGAEFVLEIGLGVDHVSARWPSSGRVAKREAALWDFYARGGDRVDEWSARWRAARGLRAKSRIGWRLIAPSLDHLELELGHRPSARERRDYRARRIRRAASELRDRWTPSSEWRRR